MNDIEKILLTNIYAIDTLEKHGYSCDEYTILKFKEVADKDYYDSILNAEYNDTTDMSRFFDIKSYVSCTGKYSYTTVGYEKVK